MREARKVEVARLRSGHRGDGQCLLTGSISYDSRGPEQGHQGAAGGGEKAGQPAQGGTEGDGCGPQGTHEGTGQGDTEKDETDKKEGR